MARHPYRRLRPAKSCFPEVGISEEGNIRSLHLGSDTVQSSMNLDRPSELVLSYSRAMMGWLLLAERLPQHITQIGLGGGSFARWLLLAERLPQHITQIGLGGGSFARWIDTYLPDTRQTAVDINPQVIAIARNLFELPFEGEKFEIIEADGAEYIKVFRHNTDVILVDGFDGEQIIDTLVEEPFFRDCRNALSSDGIFVTNWWSGDKRYQRFIERLLSVFEGRVLELPAESHGNVAVMAFQSSPKEQNIDKLKKRADKLSNAYGLDFHRMLAGLKASNPNNGKHFYL